MNIFNVHKEIIDEYQSYIGSFINIKNVRIKAKVENDLISGKLWPEPLIQFNPSFKPGMSIADLVNQGKLHNELNDIFSGYPLYEHQVEAIELGSNSKDFIVTSGTGSGKSLTYLGTIFNHILKSQRKLGVKAIIVYPMNALINSQFEEIGKYKDNYFDRTGKCFPISYAQYTGQEDDEKRKAILKDLPDIILTNYMMLELILTRVSELEMRKSIYESLQFLVFDELHTYRGRQGADVALLIRRLKAKCKKEVASIGTSATMVSGGSVLSQKEKVAEVATKFFGKPFKADQIVMETLVSSLGDSNSEFTPESVIKSIDLGVNIEGSYDDLLHNQLAKWLENNIALSVSDDEKLVRNKPQTLESIIESLSEFTGLDKTTSRKTILDLLEWISIVNVKATKEKKKTILPFKLHQFISQTGSVYMTLDQDDSKRLITLEAGKFVDKDHKTHEKKPIYPIVFSRESGHEFICVTKNTEKGRLDPREFNDWTVNEEEETEGNADGYLIIGDDIWNEDDLQNLPDSWVKTDKAGNITSVIKKYRDRIPQRIYFNEYGAFKSSRPIDGFDFQEGWFMPYKLLFDPTSGTFFDAKTSEGTKLTKLGSEGRSTSTTILSFNILRKLAESLYSEEKQKLLSFTDNRQDAALQSGHFNDFVETLHLRTGINQALKNSRKGHLEFSEIGNAVFNALDLSQSEFAASPAEFAGGKRENDDALKDYLTYRVLYDLRRSWRVILPNLEQCGLLEIKYKYLEDTVKDERFISAHRLMSALNDSERIEFVYNTLDFFRKSYAIRSQEFLAENAIDTKRRTIIQKLKSPWRFDDDEKVPRPNFMRYDTVPRNFQGFTSSIGSQSGYGKYLKKLFKDNLGETLNTIGYAEEIEEILTLLERAGWLFSAKAKNAVGIETKLYQLNIEHILWECTDNELIKSDPIKTRSYKESKRPANRFFKNIYQIDFRTMKRLRAEDHTGQINNEDRKEREELFREES
jgi:hypothetical protein